MIPVFENALLYSYNVFKEYEKTGYNLIELREMNRLDYVDLRHKSMEEIDEWLEDTKGEYCRDLNSDESHYKFYFLKEFVIKELVTPDMLSPNYQYDIFDYINPPTIVRYWRYNISKWSLRDKAKGIDSRYITVNCNFHDNSTGRYGEIISYRVKLDHIWQLILDLGGAINYSGNINLYIFPIYVHQNEKTKNGYHIHSNYTRISDLYKYKDLYYIKENLKLILDGLMRFAIINYKLIIANEKADKLKERRKYSKSTRTRKAVNEEAIEIADEIRHVTRYVDKKITVSIDDDIEMNINGNRANIYQGVYTDKVITVSDYQTQVRGHWSHYWCGHGENKVREARWIEPYQRNEKSKARVVKEYENEKII